MWEQVGEEEECVKSAQLLEKLKPKIKSKSWWAALSNGLLWLKKPEENRVPEEVLSGKHLKQVSWVQEYRGLEDVILVWEVKCGFSVLSSSFSFVEE